ncbi:hypothetical protein [Paracoccus laeviglucosivorans]|uniref:Uncharacterized protein n=1 Tax=Paracoccus laeviglucosivorans TaxID=1197861 RepID=A0A521CWU4_9RHOB|nr:hypothetical protein [Paracoccus laeviglucosivorans]SMO63882.1 hypothetical protein SAMN06265221_105218 [Paracoccus laeviglucosivorans]
MTFTLYGKPNEQLRLVAFSTEQRGGKRTITIEVEAASAYHVSFALECLDRVQQGQTDPTEGEA